MLWAPLLFFFHATQFAATVRYFLPIVPVLALVASWWLLVVPSRPRLGRVAFIAVLVATAVWAVAFSSIYRRPHTRVDASRWIYQHVPPGSGIATEHWDDALPLAVGSATPGVYRRSELPLYDDEDVNGN